MTTAQDLIGRTLQGRFVIADQLGEGGMGIVFRGLDELTMGEVAIKVLQPELAVHDEIVARFYREATAARRVDHEGAVRVLGRGNEGGLHFLVMELLAGQSLAAVLAETPALPPARAARILAQLCGALAVAHERGVVHRDVKPENIMVAPSAGVLGERVKLLDFGVAKPMPRLPSMPSYEDSFNMDVVTTCGALVGTPEYMAPEQCRGQAVDARTDLYACGVLLYRMMTGRVPFDGVHPLELCQRHLGEAPRSPREIAPWVAPEIEAIILKALQKSPADRYQSATELRDAVLHALGQLEQATGVEDTESFSFDALGVAPPPSEVEAPSGPEPVTLLFVSPREAAALVPPPRTAVPDAGSWHSAVSVRRVALYAVVAACMGTIALSLSTLFHP
jgi:eukaryotic-like serine/threonine-protein kinase